MVHTAVLGNRISDKGGRGTWRSARLLRPDKSVIKTVSHTSTNSKSVSTWTSRHGRHGLHSKVAPRLLLSAKPKTLHTASNGGCRGVADSKPRPAVVRPLKSEHISWYLHGTRIDARHLAQRRHSKHAAHVSNLNAGCMISQMDAILILPLRSDGIGQVRQGGATHAPV